YFSRRREKNFIRSNGSTPLRARSTCFSARKALASCTGSLLSSRLYRCQERRLQRRLKAALAPRIPTEPTRNAQPSCCSSLPIFIVPLPEYASAASRSSGPLSAGYGNFQGRNALGVYRRRSRLRNPRDAGTASTLLIDPVGLIPFFRMGSLRFLL